MTTFPGYSSNKPFMSSIRNLKGELGLNDSCIQGTEVAIRHLIDTSNLSGSNNTEYIRKLSEKYSISHGIDDFEELMKSTSKSYIVQTYNMFELFFKSLIDEYRQHKGVLVQDWKTQKNGKNIDLFNQFILNVKSKKNSAFKIAPEKELLEYYRLVRISIVHNSPSTIKKAQQFFNKHIVTNMEHFKNYKMSAPNAPNELSYDDFVIYTRSIKYYSQLLNESCDISATDIFNVVKLNSKYKQRVKSIYHKDNPEMVKKIIKSLRLYYLHNYGKNNIKTREEFVRLYLTYLDIPRKVYVPFLK